MSPIPVNLKRGTLAAIMAIAPFSAGEPVLDWTDDDMPQLYIANRTGELKALMPSPHEHAVADVTGLAGLLTGKSDVGHGHTTLDIAGLATALSGKANTAHGHAIGDVSGLDALLDGFDTAITGKAALSHNHAISDVSGLAAELAAISGGGGTNPFVFDIRLYGALPNNTTFDQTPNFHNAIADVVTKGGGTIYVPAGTYAGNILLDVNGVNFQFESWQAQSSGTTHNHLVPWDVNKPAFQIGNNTKLLNGFYINNLCLHGIGPNGTGHVGMLMPGGVNRGHFVNLSVRRFSDMQMSLTSVGAFCTEYVYFDGLNLEGNSVTAGSAVLNMHYGGEVSGSWVTAVYINNFSILSMDGEPCIVTEGVQACFTNGWIQCGLGTATRTGGAVLRTRTTAGGTVYYPSLAGWNVQMEVAGANALPANDVRRVAVEHYANSRAMGIWLKGDWSFSLGCRMKLLDGTLIPIDNVGTVLGSPQLLYPSTVAAHYFAETSNPYAENCTIQQVSGNFEFRNSTNNAYISARSNGNLDFYPFGARALQLTGASNHVNYLKGTSNAAGGTPRLQADGQDANISLELGAKGTGDVRILLGSLCVNTVGDGLCVKEGTNAKQGVATLVAGAVTVPNTAVKATTRIFLQRQTDGGTVGASYSITRVADTSFTIQAKDAAGANNTTDTSIIGYEMFDPA